MRPIEYIIGGVLLLLAAILIVVIGKQQSQRHGLGSSIAGTGASESYLSKHNIANKGKRHQKITLIVAIIFIVLTLALYVVGTIPETQDDTSATSSTTEVSQ